MTGRLRRSRPAAMALRGGLLSGGAQSGREVSRWEDAGGAVDQDVGHHARTLVPAADSQLVNDES